MKKRGGACRINEIKFTGSEVIDDSNNSYDCKPTLHLKSLDKKVEDTKKEMTAVTYQGAKTAVVKTITPRYGSVVGGESVTFGGTGFDSNHANYEIIIDGVACVATAATSTSVTCTTAKRPGLRKSTLSITMTGKGSVSTQGKVFRYVQLWSSDTTWGGEFSPMDGETVHVPEGFNLLVDVDRTPKLNAVLVEGSLIFAPNA